MSLKLDVSSLKTKRWGGVEAVGESEPEAGLENHSKMFNV